MKPERHKVRVSVYLLLYRDDQLLLALRQNTGYQDGNYSLVAGHVDAGEAPTHAMIREAKEEIGIDISPEDLTAVHTMYRKSNCDYIDIFMTCTRWSGDVVNAEPDKCGDVRFFPVTQLPANTLAYVLIAIKYIAQGVSFSEHGF